MSRSGPRRQAYAQRDWGKWPSGSDRATQHAREDLPVCHLGETCLPGDRLWLPNGNIPQAFGLTKTHVSDALCVATLATGEVVAMPQTNVYRIAFRPRQTRRQYHDLPRKGQGRVKYQVNEVLADFRKGDVVRVKGRFVKQIHSIYSNGYLAFKRVKGEPFQALPRDCQLLERGQTILCEKVA